METRDPQTFAVIGAAMAVHSELGPGFLERVYAEALAVEFRHQGLPFRAQVDLPVRYRGCTLASRYRVDFLCFDSLLVEVKALRALSGLEQAQLIHYLKASGTARGMLLNFGAQRLEYRRFVHTGPATPPIEAP